MTLAIEDPQFPTLFVHKLRKEWGVGLLSGERNGKRSYLFEDAEERTLADGFYQLMEKVANPTPEQRSAYSRLRSILAARARRSAAASGQSDGWNLSEQLAVLHEKYIEGLADPKWTAEIRGEGAEERSPSHRQSAVEEAQSQLSPKALDELLDHQQFGQVWDRVMNTLRHTDLVPAAQFKQKAPSNEHLRNLAFAVREMLHGTAVYATRFDRFLTAYVAAFGELPRWELATAPSALVHPTEHISVNVTVIRRQLKASSMRRSVPTQPSSSGYATCLSVARLLANKLTEQEEAPRDLLDVRDFIALTLKPIPSTAAVRRKSAAKSSAAAPEA